MQAGKAHTGFERACKSPAARSWSSSLIPPGAQPFERALETPRRRVRVVPPVLAQEKRWLRGNLQKRQAEVRHEHHRDRQEVQAIRGRGTRCDEGARPSAEGGSAPGGRERALLAKIAEMQGPDRAMANRLHAIIKASAPARSPKTLVRDARVCQGRQGRLLLPKRGEVQVEVRDVRFQRRGEPPTKALCGRPPSR
jgi:hypothetical protein